jgi:hypothetical protein
MAGFSRFSVALSDASIYNAGLSLSIAVLLFLILRVLIDYAKILSLRRRMPPGPFPLPLFGNYFSIPGERPWLKFEEWSTKTYNSPLITIWNGTAPTILCNDAWSISDLLDKRASIYSSRPRCVLMGDCTGATTTNQILQPYGDRWRLHRRLTVSIFSFVFPPMGNRIDVISMQLSGHKMFVHSVLRSQTRPMSCSVTCSKNPT